jgi:hypothetical protein
MKYLRKFNEDISLDDIKSKIENNIAYLLDLGYKVVIDDKSNEIDIRSVVNPNEEFIWDNVKDDIIPMLMLINEEYEKVKVSFWFDYYQNIEYVKSPTHRQLNPVYEDEVLIFDLDNLLEDNVDYLKDTCETDFITIISIKLG